jgi:hypothetical protein
MASIKSDLTNKNFAGSAMRQFDVPDEDEDQGPDIVELNKRMAERGLPPVDEATVRQMYAMQQGAGGGDGGGRGGNRPKPPPTETENLYETERVIKEARVAKLHGKTRLNEGARRRIEILCGMTRSTRTADLDGTIFSLRTLKNKELREALVLASEFDGSVESPFEIRKQLLARSLYEVAGTDITLFLGDSSLDAVYEFLDEIDENLLTRLYSEYLLLTDEAAKKFAIKSEADAKEVVEDLKK